ncbi:DUF1016 family protein [Candidatus Gracilibacteria bacterium]|nr:DUF1016 family protein [Candidatus Gracilibacteria bacterium]
MENKTLKTSSSEYKKFLVDIKQEILQSQKRAFKQVNKELVQLYFKIGNLISQKINKSDWGKSIVENVSDDIKRTFPGIKGFSKQNIWNMIKFYEFYNQNKKLQPLAGEISWSNNMVILEKCKTDFQKEYYLKLSGKIPLSKRVLQNKIDSQEFERVLSTQKTHNLDLTLEEEQKEVLENTIKDEYVFDFLNLGEKYKESELEQALIDNLEKFLLELGKGFAFVGRQYNLQVDGDDYFLDLLFYHTKLKCYIVVELKIGSFKPEFFGKMNFYLNVVDDFVKEADDNKTIGLLICKDKKKQTVEYALKGIDKPMVVSEYHHNTLPDNFQKSLPTEEEIYTFLKNF